MRPLRHVRDGDENKNKDKDKDEDEDKKKGNHTQRRAEAVRVRKKKKETQRDRSVSPRSRSPVHGDTVDALRGQGLVGAAHHVRGFQGRLQALGSVQHRHLTEPREGEIERRGDRVTSEADS